MNLSQFCTQSIFGNNGTYICCVLEWNWRPSTMVGACAKIFLKSLEWLHYLNNKLFSWSKSFYKKKLGSVFACHTDSSIQIYNTISFSNLSKILGQWLLQVILTHTGKDLVGISSIGMELMFSEYILGQYLT